MSGIKQQGSNFSRAAAAARTGAEGKSDLDISYSSINWGGRECLFA